MSIQMILIFEFGYSIGQVTGKLVTYNLAAELTYKLQATS